MNKYYAASHLLVGKHKVHKDLSYKMIVKQTQAFWKLYPLEGMMGTLDSWKKKKLQMIVCSITETSCILVFITWQLIIMLSRSVASNYLQPHGL